MFEHISSWIFVAFIVLLISVVYASAETACLYLRNRFVSWLKAQKAKLLSRLGVFGPELP